MFVPSRLHRLGGGGVLLYTAFIREREGWIPQVSGVAYLYVETRRNVTPHDLPANWIRLIELVLLAEYMELGDHMMTHLSNCSLTYLVLCHHGLWGTIYLLPLWWWYRPFHTGSGYYGSRFQVSQAARTVPASTTGVSAPMTDRSYVNLISHDKSQCQWASNMVCSRSNPGRLDVTDERERHQPR